MRVIVDDTGANIAVVTWAKEANRNEGIKGRSRGAEHEGEGSKAWGNGWLGL